MSYRKDIEGLRAVAILLVVAAHAKVPGLSGGFIGVDVFFVLSGYLITSLLMREIRETGSVALTAFYARRFRRLMPALLFMLLAACAAASLILPAAGQIAQATSAASAAAWVSNLQFAFSDIGYFDPSAEHNIFLHTWSLGVEEQFYLVWPAVLLLGIRAGSEARLRGVMLALLVASLAACVILSNSSPHLAFYLMPTRGWQFALGAMVALYAMRVPAWLGWAGLTMIFGAAAFIGPTAVYPGALALIPSLGTAAVIAAGSRTFGPTAMLSAGPMQALGHISYSWYLWHWPVLLLGAMALPGMQLPLRTALLVGLSLALAAISYRLVENPIRRSRRWLTRPRVALAAALTLMAAGNIAAISWNNSASERLTEPEQQLALRAKSDTPTIYGLGCDDWFHSAAVKVCAFGHKDADHTAVVMGDSIGLQWFPALAEVFGQRGWRLLVLTKSSCPMVDAPFVYDRIGREYTECAQWRSEALRQIVAISPDVLILGSTHTYGFTQEQWVEGTARVLLDVSTTARHVVIIRSTPVLPFDGPDCLAPGAFGTNNQCAALAANAEADAVYTWLQAAAERFGNVAVIDMNDSVCPDGICHAKQNGLVAFRDSQHISAQFARSLTNSLAEHLEPALN